MMKGFCRDLEFVLHVPFAEYVLYMSSGAESASVTY